MRHFISNKRILQSQEMIVQFPKSRNEDIKEVFLTNDTFQSEHICKRYVKALQKYYYSHRERGNFVCSKMGCVGFFVPECAVVPPILCDNRNDFDFFFRSENVMKFCEKCQYHTLHVYAFYFKCKLSLTTLYQCKAVPSCHIHM